MLECFFGSKEEDNSGDTVDLEGRKFDYLRDINLHPIKFKERVGRLLYKNPNILEVLGKEHQRYPDRFSFVLIPDTNLVFASYTNLGIVTKERKVLVPGRGMVTEEGKEIFPGDGTERLLVFPARTNCSIYAVNLANWDERYGTLNPLNSKNGLLHDYLDHLDHLDHTEQSHPLDKKYHYDPTKGRPEDYLALIALELVQQDNEESKFPRGSDFMISMPIEYDPRLSRRKFIGFAALATAAVATGGYLAAERILFPPQASLEGQPDDVVTLETAEKLLQTIGDKCIDTNGTQIVENKNVDKHLFGVFITKDGEKIFLDIIKGIPYTTPTIWARWLQQDAPNRETGSLFYTNQNSTNVFFGSTLSEQPYINQDMIIWKDNNSLDAFEAVASVAGDISLTNNEVQRLIHSLADAKLDSRHTEELVRNLTSDERYILLRVDPTASNKEDFRDALIWNGYKINM